MSDAPTSRPVEFRVDGRAVSVDDDGASLLEVLRDRLGIRGSKDGCSPQGQCGCCTVLVDGQARVACVTPVSRVRGREVTTIDGLEPDVRDRWSNALCATGGSQCGFCTPGIIVRLATRASAGPLTDDAVDQALLAHLCRCTGWQTIREAAALATSANDEPLASTTRTTERYDAASRRASIEGRSEQVVNPSVALGRGGFADDTSPTDALVGVLDGDEWVLAETLTAARRAAGKVQGRRTTSPLVWPIDLPDGDWVRTLQTTWVEPAYLEPDAVWCLPGREPVGPLGNGGAFGGKLETAERLRKDARRLADEHDRPVRLLLAREDSVRLGVKRPPIAAGLRADGSGVIRIARTEGIAEAIRSIAPQLTVEEVDIVGPRTSASLRAAGWAEAAVLLSALDDGPVVAIRSPDGARATAQFGDDGSVHVSVSCGEVLDEPVLRSYCIGAAHMALGWVRSEGLTVSPSGEVEDLTIRSFGVLRSADMPHVHVTIDHSSDGPAINGSDAVFAAVAAAAWRAEARAGEWPSRWPVRR